ncbi:MAG: glycosyltransferase [Patescibacteria group bacterium]
MSNKSVSIIYLITKGNWGGAQRYVYDLATNLPTNRWRPLVVHGRGEELPAKLTSAGMETLRLDSLNRDINFLAEIITFFRLIKLFRTRRPAVLHLNSPKASGLGALAGRLTGVPRIIYTAHGWTFNEARGPLARTLIRFFSWLTVLLAHQTIVIAESERLAAPRFLIRPGKIKLIRHGLTAPDYLPATVAREKIMSLVPTLRELEPNAAWLGMIAELHRNKGLAYAIQTIKQLGNKNLALVIVGEGEERSTLSNLIERLGLGKKIFLLGQQAGAAELLLAFDLFLLTSIKEGLPYVVLEAGLAGRPVVATAVGGLRDIIEPMKTGLLVKPKRPDEIARAITFLLDHPNEAEQMGQTLKSKVEKDFSTSRMLAETINLYNLV